MLAETQILTESMVYWITRLDGLRDLAVGFGVTFGVLCFIGLIIALLMKFLEGIKGAGKFIPMSIIGILLGILLSISSIFIPTTKEYCAIKAIPMIVNNNEAQELPNKLIELATEWSERLLEK